MRETGSAFTKGERAAYTTHLRTGPRNRNTVFAALVVACLGALVSSWTARSLPRPERIVAMVAYAAHLLAAAAQVFVTTRFYGAGDSTAYFEKGSSFASFVSRAPESFGPELVRMTLKAIVPLPGAEMSGSSTGAMQGIAAWIVLLLGDSFFAANVFAAVTASIGLLLLYRASRERLALAFDWRVAALMLCTPSVVYWTSGLLKESFAVTGLGLAVFGVVHFFRGSRLSGAALTVVGTLLIYLLKPYILAATLVAGCAFMLAWRNDGRFSPRLVVATALGGVVGLWAVGLVFPEFALAGIGEELLHRQVVGASVEGGSNYVMMGEAPSLAAQLILAPLAVATSLYRPLIFEVHNALSAVSAAESTVFLVLSVKAVFRRGRQLLDLLFGSPERVFVTFFVIVMGLGVGLSTTNMGTLSRYRVPLLPFFAMILATASRRDPTRS